MNNIIMVFQNPTVLVSVILANVLISIIFLVCLIINNSRYKKLNKKYTSFMQNLGDEEKIEGMLESYINNVANVYIKSEELQKKLDILERNLSKCVQKIGVVRYNAFDDTGSDLSFTVALLDAQDTGFVMNGLYSRDSSSIFAKPVVKGESRYNLSAEEVQAINLARTSGNVVYGED